MKTEEQIRQMRKERADHKALLKQDGNTYAHTLQLLTAQIAIIDKILE